MLKIGGISINNLAIGDKTVNKAYLGDKLVFGGGGVFNTEYEAVLNEAELLGFALPSADNQISQNNKVTALKTSGFWDKTDGFWWFEDDGDINFKSINWKTPSGAKGFEEDRGGGGLKWSNKGIEGDAKNLYDLNINAMNTVNYTLFDATICVGINKEKTVSNPAFLSAQNLSDSTRPVLLRNDGYFQKLNTSYNADSDIGDFSGVGQMGITRRAFDNLSNIFVNGVVQESDIIAPLAIPDDNFKLFYSGSNNNAGNSEIGFVFIGGSVIGEELDLYNALKS